MIIFTAHALQRMHERKVSRRQVAATVKEPDLVETEEDGVRLFKRKFNTHILEVVAETAKAKIIIMTVYWI